MVDCAEALRGMEMSVVPVVRCRDVQRSVEFYTRVLGFRLKGTVLPPLPPVVDLISPYAEIQLSALRGDGEFGCVINVHVDDADSLFQSFLRNGLDPSRKTGSPVHQGPVNQTWGTREFYVNDPDGNTLRFRQPIRA